MNHGERCTDRSICDSWEDGAPCPSGLRFYRKVLTETGHPLDDAPGCLRSLGLVTEDPREPGTAQAVPPATARYAACGPLRERVAEYQSVERALQAAFAVAESAYAEVRRHEAPPFTVHHGDEPISQALEAAVDQCRQELLTAQPGGSRPDAHLASALQRDMRLLSRGVVQRTLYQHTVRSHQPTLNYIAQVTEAGAEVRTLTEVFERLIICDREVAFLPISDDRSTAALELRHPAVVRYLANSFNRDWRRGVAVVSGRPQNRSTLVASDIQRTILRGVISGETDESIARRLGLSRRSVAEHVRKISAQLGSSSRAQLGYLVATTNFLSSPE
ncbi:LuxR C-terminal-related transcriptional regulator [Streptomyces sp. O3]